MRIPSPRLFLSLSATLLASACSGFPELPDLPDVTSKLQPYRINIRQGNFITQEMVTKLRAGQSKEQVRFILGSPLIEDVFHAQRWDYIYRFTVGHGPTAERRLTVFFDADKLVRVTGDVVANSAEAEAADQQALANRTRVVEIGGAGPATDGKAAAGSVPAKP